MVMYQIIHVSPKQVVEVKSKIVKVTFSKVHISEKFFEDFNVQALPNFKTISDASLFSQKKMISVISRDIHNYLNLT